MKKRLKMLYIDNHMYLHNRDIHIDFISSLEKNNYFKIVGLGPGLKGKLRKVDGILDKRNLKSQILSKIRVHRPDFLLTYNPGGKNIKKFKWLEDILPKIPIPKIHITVDYMREGYVEEEARWFSDMNYQASIFRTKSALRHASLVPVYNLPFSISTSLYRHNINTNIGLKAKKVGFLGTSDLAPELYFKRIAAINHLRLNNLLKETRFIDSLGRRQMIFGKDYVKFLSGNLFNLTCPGSCDFFTAKHFQIPAAFSMLVCTDVSGLEDFPKDCYIKYDLSNMDKLVEDVLFHASNLDITEVKIRRLYNHVIKNHSHKQRGLELKRVVEEVLA